MSRLDPATIRSNIDLLTGSLDSPRLTPSQILAVGGLMKAARTYADWLENWPSHTERQHIRDLVECAVHGDNLDAVVSEILAAVREGRTE